MLAPCLHFLQLWHYLSNFVINSVTTGKLLVFPCRSSEKYLIMKRSNFKYANNLLLSLFFSTGQTVSLTQFLSAHTLSGVCIISLSGCLLFWMLFKVFVPFDSVGYHFSFFIFSKQKWGQTCFKLWMDSGYKQDLGVKLAF